MFFIIRTMRNRSLDHQELRKKKKHNLKKFNSENESNDADRAQPVRQKSELVAF